MKKFLSKLLIAFSLSALSLLCFTPLAAEAAEDSWLNSVQTGASKIFDSVASIARTTTGVDITGTQGPKNIFKVQHYNNVTVVDHMHPGLPKVRIGHRVADIVHGAHFDDILMDAPDAVRPASVIVFYDSSDATCMKNYNALNWDYIAENNLPARSQVFTSRYDMYPASIRSWYEFTPEMDLKKRFGVKSCPEVQFISRKCDGFTDWCVKGTDPTDENLKLIGCENFKEQCTKDKRKVWNPKKDGDLVGWITSNLKKEGKPQLSKFLGSYHEQGRWLQRREHTTCNTHLRNNYLAQAFPAFTKRGFKAMPIPEPVQEWLLDFVKTHEHHRKTEHWNAESTQMSFHEKPTTFIDMDLVRAKKERMANEYLKPILEEWSGMKPLELTSFYGMREYHEGAWLRQHVDRIDTHVLSITLSVAKKNFTFDTEGKHDYKPWPLQVTDWTGQQVAYDHPAGTMILYESSKLPHGRPTRNDGGIHLGCFVHFKPLNMHGSDAKKWDGIATTARKNQNDHASHIRFKATEEIEPPQEEIEWAEHVGDGSSWKKAGEKGASSDSFSVTFKNSADRDLDVFWYSTNIANAVQQGSAGPGTSFKINTYHGHKFFWAEKGTQVPTKGGKFTVDIGKKMYYYKFKKDGTLNE